MPLRSLIVFLACVLFSGCESLPDRFAAVPTQTLAVDGSVEQVYFAAQKAFKRLDFTLVHSSMGRIEAASAINSSVALGDSRQTVARVKITQGDSGKTDVEIAISEEVTSESMGGTRRQPMKEHSFLPLYFATLQQVLQEQASDRAAQKN